MADSRKSQHTNKASGRAKRSSLSVKRKTRHPPMPNTKHRKGERVQESDVELRRGRGTQARGRKSGGFFWHIYHKDVRAGCVFVNYDETTAQASIQIFINRKSQSRGIGRIAYRRACEESGYSEVYAFMRQSNIASLRAAMAAGFHEVQPHTSQVTMVWKKS